MGRFSEMHGQSAFAMDTYSRSEATRILGLLNQGDSSFTSRIWNQLDLYAIGGKDGHGVPQESWALKKECKIS
jgi:hypothetical protein